MSTPNLGVKGQRTPTRCPPNYKHNSIAELFKEFQVKLQGACIKDPCGENNYFFVENFPHLVKLEFYNDKLSQWVDAKASVAVQQLLDGTLDESKYRVGDSSRPRTLFWVTDILSNPDEIHVNIRDKDREIYSKRYNRGGKGPATLKVVLVTKKGMSRAVITSFWCTEKYHKGCIKLPAKHP